VCCSVLQCVAKCGSVVQRGLCIPPAPSVLRASSDYRVLQGVAVWSRVLQSVAACGSVLQGVAVRCSVLQCVAVRCSVLQRDL